MGPSIKNISINDLKKIDKGEQTRPNKEISVFWVTGLKNLSRVGTHFLNFFSGQNIS